MIDLEQFKYMEPEDVSDERMEYFTAELLKMQEELSDAWAEEIQKLDNDNFDPYSFWGEKKINKISKKYTSQIVDIDMLLEVIDKEMARRKEYAEQQRALGNKKYIEAQEGDKKFIEREQQKTERIRKKYEDK